MNATASRDRAAPSNRPPMYRACLLTLSAAYSRSSAVAERRRITRKPPISPTTTTPAPTPSTRGTHRVVVAATAAAGGRLGRPPAPVAVLAVDVAVLGGLRHRAVLLDDVGPVGLEHVGVAEDDHDAVLVEDLLHLLDDLGARLRVDLGPLLRVELVVGRVAVVGVGLVRRAGFGRPDATGLDAEDVVRVGVDRPAGEEEVELAGVEDPADVIARGRLDLDADLGQPLLHEGRDLAVLRVVGVHELRRLRRTAVR